jgi:hypothetical protein
MSIVQLKTRTFPSNVLFAYTVRESRVGKGKRQEEGRDCNRKETGSERRQEEEESQ